MGVKPTFLPDLFLLKKWPHNMIFSTRTDIFCGLLYYLENLLIYSKSIPFNLVMVKSPDCVTHPRKHACKSVLLPRKLMNSETRMLQDVRRPTADRNLSTAFPILPF